MNNYSKSLFLFLFASIFAVSYPQAQTKTVISKPPKFTLTFALSYNYALSRAFGDLTSCTILYDPITQSRIFTGPKSASEVMPALLISTSGTPFSET